MSNLKSQISNLKKYWLFLVLSLIVILGAYFYLFVPSTKTPAVTVPKPTPIPTSLVTSLPPIESGFAPTNQIVWRLETLPIPETLPVIHIAGPSANPAAYSPLASVLGIATQPTKLSNQPVYLWFAEDNASSFYVNLQDKIASYSLSQNAGELPTIGQKLKAEDLADQLANLLSPVLNLSGDFSLAPGDIKYLNIEEERFVPASQNQASFVEINLNYSFRSFVLTYRGVPAVVAKYSLYGPLVSLRLSLPFSQTSLSPDYSLKTFTEIKETPVDQFEIVSESGGRAFELSDQEEVLKSVIVTGGYVGYLTNSTSSAVAPYVFLTGTSTTSRFGQINVTLATPALKLQ